MSRVEERLVRHSRLDNFLWPAASRPGYPDTRRPDNWSIRDTILDLLPNVQSQQMVADRWYQLQEERFGEPKRPPSGELKQFPGSKLLAYGWERAVYELPYKLNGQEWVVKVPRHDDAYYVNLDAYHKGTILAYRLCDKYAGQLHTADSFFDIRNNTSLFYQEKLPITTQPLSVHPETASPVSKKHFKDMGVGLLKLLSLYHWMPDLQLRRSTDGTWSMDCVALDDEGVPKIYDFTAYYDIYRISPDLAKQNAAESKAAWETFTQQMAA